MSMKKKIYILILLVAFTMCLGITSNTYSRYAEEATGNVDMMFANWQILVNTKDITTNKKTELTFDPVFTNSSNISDKHIAPTSSGYFDINIDPSNAELSFRYTIEFENMYEDMPDLKLTEYAIIPENYIEGQTLTFIPLNENKITNELEFKKEEKNFKFKKILIRVRFKWIEGEGELMNDEADTALGIQAADENAKTFKIKTKLSFEQILNLTPKEEVQEPTNNVNTEEQNEINEPINIEEQPSEEINNKEENPNNEEEIINEQEVIEEPTE